MQRKANVGVRFPNRKGMPMLVSSFDMMRDAHEKGYAIPSPDFVDSNSARAFVQVAEELHQPLILSFAEVHLKHLSLEEAAALGTYYAQSVQTPVAPPP